MTIIFVLGTISLGLQAINSGLLGVTGQLCFLPMANLDSSYKLVTGPNGIT